MESYTNLKNQFLIAMPGLLDPHFFRTVTYIFEHNDEGAMGVIINQALDVSIKELFDHLKLETAESFESNQAVLSGGPVQVERGFVLHSPVGEWKTSMALSEDIAVTTSEDILTAIANNTGPNNIQIILGYAGWDAGQLEQEILENAWLNVPADADVLFNTDIDQRWQVATSRLGIDINQLSPEVGHS